MLLGWKVFTGQLSAACGTAVATLAETKPGIPGARLTVSPMREKLGLGDRHPEDGSEESVGVLRTDVTFRFARMNGTEPMLSVGSGEPVVAGGLAASSRGFCDAHQSNPFTSTLSTL
jgi:hypothetical protein